MVQLHMTVCSDRFYRETGGQTPINLYAKSNQRRFEISECFQPTELICQGEVTCLRDDFTSDANSHVSLAFSGVESTPSSRSVVHHMTGSSDTPL